MSRQLPNPGTYAARRNSAMVVSESENGALLLWIPYVLVNAGIQFTDKHMVVLGQKDGTVSDRNRKTLMKIWPSWDGVDFFALEELPMPEDPEAAEFELADCFHDDSYTPPDSPGPIIQFKAQWLNPLGGTANVPTALPEEDRKAVRTKWLSKFKALGGSKPAEAPKAAAPKAAPAQSAAPKAAPAVQPASGTASKPKSAGPPSRGKGGSPAVGGTPRTATQEEAWDALVKANPDTGEDELGTRYYAAQDEVAPGANGDLNPAQWGEVMTKLGL